MIRTFILAAAAVAAAACSSTSSPTTPSATTAGSSATSACAVPSVLSAVHSNDRVSAVVRGGDCPIPVGVAVYKRLQTTAPLTDDNLALYGDANARVGTGEVKELSADVPPCGPFRYVVYYMRSSAGTPATAGIPSRYNLAPEHVLASGVGVWNRWPDCVVR